MGILFILRVFDRNLLKGNRRWNYFLILFWCLTWGSNPGFSSNRPTHYLLDHGDFKVSLCGAKCLLPLLSKMFEKILLKSVISTEINKKKRNLRKYSVVFLKHFPKKERYLADPVLSNEFSVQKFSKVLMDLDCLSQNVLISRLHEYQKSSNICGFCKYYYFRLCKHWLTTGETWNCYCSHEWTKSYNPNPDFQYNNRNIFNK